MLPWKCACGRLNPPSQPTCPTCHYTSPDPTQQYSASSRQNPTGWIALGVLIPIAGVIMGLIQAFDPDPEGRRMAGYSFASALAGFLLGLFLLWGWMRQPPLW